MADIFDEIAAEQNRMFKQMLPKTTLEMESGFAALPEGSKVESVSPVTGQRVTGRAYPSLGQVASEQVPLSAAPQQPSRWDIPGAFAQGTKQGVASLAGMPVDMISAGINALSGGRGPQNPVGGSQSILNAFQKAGIPDYQYNPSLSTNIANRVGQFIPGVITTPVLGGGKSAWDAMRQTIAPTLGSGVAAGTAATAFPNNPLAEVTASLLGGFTPAAAQYASGQTKTLPSLVKTHLGRSAPINKNELANVSRANDAIEEMIQVNRTKPFEYVDENNRIYRTGLPQTVDEAWQAFPQAKIDVYKQYNKAQKQAGQQGFVIDGDDIVNDFTRWATDPSQSPTFRKAATGWLDDVEKTYGGKIWTPEQIEKEMANLNAVLFAHKKVPNPNDVSNMAKSGEIVSILNKRMDDGISLLSGDNYQQLRGRYGALKSIEDRLQRAATAQYNRVNKDVPSYLPKGWDAGWALEIMGSFATGHPYAALAGLAAIGGPRVKKWIVDPDRNIRKLFERADKIVPKRGNTSLLTPERPMPQVDRSRQIEAPVYEGEIIPPQKSLPPLPNNRLEYTGRTGNAPIESGWSPVLNPGQRASRMTVRNPTVQEQAPFDYDSALKTLVDSGMNPVEARDHILRLIKQRVGG